MSGARLEIPPLSKTRFLAGLQCHKRLYLECYEPALSTPIDLVRRAVLDTGHAVEIVARRRFRGGVLIDHAQLGHSAAVLATQAAIADPTNPSIYEAAVTGDDVRVRADILVRTAGDSFDLVEVKSSTKVTPEHEWDVAVQLHALESAGVRVRRAYLMHLDRSYVYQGGDHDLERLFALEDLTESVRSRQSNVHQALAKMRGPLGFLDAPSIAVGPHCEEPRECPFYDHCHDGLPSDPFAALPRLTRKLRQCIDGAGIRSLDELPFDFHGLSLIQRRALEALRSGNRVVDPAIRHALASVRFPLHFLDFETFSPAIPIYVATHPYDPIPVQWSDHVLYDSGAVEHREFLQEGEGDPRREFAERLLQATSGAGSVVVYSSFEDQRPADLQLAVPDLDERLGSLRARLVDLLPIIRGHVYDPAFGTSFSIKSVLPAIVQNLGYDDLEIQEGTLVSVAFAEMRLPETPPERRQKLRAGLLAYCKRDTEAMLELFKVLR
jgi:hypothetical protein